MWEVYRNQGVTRWSPGAGETMKCRHAKKYTLRRQISQAGGGGMGAGVGQQRTILSLSMPRVALRVSTTSWDC